MCLQTRRRLEGKVISVNHSLDHCQITIELNGTLELTAAIMKESSVEWGLVEGTQVRAEVDASSVLVGAYPGVECACSV